MSKTSIKDIVYESVEHQNSGGALNTYIDYLKFKETQAKESASHNHSITYSNNTNNTDTSPYRYTVNQNPFYTTTQTPPWANTPGTSPPGVPAPPPARLTGVTVAKEGKILMVTHPYYRGTRVAVVVDADKCSSTCLLVVEHHGPCWECSTTVVDAHSGALALIQDLVL